MRILPRNLKLLLPGLVVLLGIHAVSALAGPGELHFSSTAASVFGGDQLTVNVLVDDTHGLFAAQFSLTYDNTLFEIVDVAMGSAWPVADTYIARKTFTNGGTANESIEFAATLTAPGTLPAGSLLSITFQAKNPIAPSAVSPIAFGSSVPLMLAGNDGFEIPSLAPSALIITINRTDVTGAVTLQASGTGRMATIAISKGAFLESVQEVSGNPFTLTLLSGSGYTLTATAPCHMDAVKTDVTAPSSSHTTTLTAGDANHDNAVNILDISFVGIEFGMTGIATCANMNGDTVNGGTVNILDLSQAALCFGLVGPTTW